MNFDIDLPSLTNPLEFPFPEGASLRIFGMEKNKLSPNVFLTTIPFIYEVARSARKWDQESQGWYRVLTGTVHGVDIAFVHSSVGGTNVLNCINFLRICGVTNLVFIGWCGGLLDKVKHGDLFLPENVLRCDHLSEIVLPSLRVVAANQEMNVKIISALEGLQDSVPMYKTPIVSLSAICQETPTLLKKLYCLGLGGVDLESAAVLSAGKAWSIKTATLLIVSDCPLRGDYLITPDKPSAACKKSSQIITKWVLEKCNLIFS